MTSDGQFDGAAWRLSTEKCTQLTDECKFDQLHSEVRSLARSLDLPPLRRGLSMKPNSGQPPTIRPHCLTPKSASRRGELTSARGGVAFSSRYRRHGGSVGAKQAVRIACRPSVLASIGRSPTLRDPFNTVLARPTLPSVRPTELVSGIVRW